MKNSGKLIGILLMLLIAGNSNLNAQRGIRGSMDSSGMHRMGGGMNPYGPGVGERRMNRGPDSIRMREMMHGRDSLNMRGMRQEMGMRMSHMEMGRGYMMPYPGHGMGKGMNQMPMNRMSREMGHESRMGMMRQSPGRMIEGIPGLTDKQKKEIGDLRLKQQEEMIKYRDEMSAKMKTLRENNRKKMLDLLTEEQKKFVEERSGSTASTQGNRK